MTTRLSALRRLERVYGLVEEMHSLTLRRAAGLLIEAETALAEQHGAIEECAAVARRALSVGDRQQWLIAGMQQTAGHMRRQRLKLVRSERKDATDAAVEEYEASRRRSEQMKRLVKQGLTAETLVSNRQRQAAADDRFLSRKRWSELRLDQG